MLAHEREQLVGRRRFARDGEVVGLGENLAKALPDDGVIISNGDPDHGRGSGLIIGQYAFITWRNARPVAPARRRGPKPRQLVARTRPSGRRRTGRAGRL